MGRIHRSKDVKLGDTSGEIEAPAGGVMK